MRAVTPHTAASARRGSGVDTGVEVLLGAAVVATVLAQHPLRVFDRLRSADRTGLLLPDWRLFAPNPVTHDFHLLYRRFQGKAASDWEIVSRISPRRARQMVWFPERREEKAVLDICQELSHLAAQGEPDLQGAASYRILRDYLRRTVLKQHPEAHAFQFMIVRTAGHDETEDPQCVYVSGQEPVG